MTPAVETAVDAVLAALDYEHLRCSYLIQKWEEFAHEVKEGYKFTIYDYENDLDAREILEEVLLSDCLSELQNQELGETLRRPDELYLAATNPQRGEPFLNPEFLKSRRKHSVWGDRIPKLLVGELRNDLLSGGVPTGA